MLKVVLILSCTGTCRLDASHHCLVVNEELPFVAVHFPVFVVVPAAHIHRTCKSHPSSRLLVARIYRTRRSDTSHGSTFIRRR